MKPTLVILSPNYLANPNQINGNTKPLIEKIATKKGNSERIYRNTMLFLVCNETSISSLQSSVREYLACQKINQEYQSQLETDQRQEVRRRMEEAGQKSDKDLGATYNILLKHTVKNGIQKLIIKENRDTLDSQIDNTIVNLLKQEFWILDSVGLNTFKTNNLVPTVEQNLSVKEVAEAFIRYDDKEMVSSLEAVSNSLQKYCENGEFCIAYGDGKTFSRYYLGERISFFDVSSTDYWLVDKSKKPSIKVEEQPITEPVVGGSVVIIPNIVSSPSIVQEPAEKNVFSVSVSGKVSFENYTQIMNSFIIPLMNNEVEIELKVKGKSTSRNPIKENGQLHNSIKESAKQLGLKFEVE